MVKKVKSKNNVLFVSKDKEVTILEAEIHFVIEI